MEAKAAEELQSLGSDYAPAGADLNGLGFMSLLYDEMLPLFLIHVFCAFKS